MTSHLKPEQVGARFMLLHTQLLDNPNLYEIEEFMHQYRHAKTQHLHHYLKARFESKSFNFRHLQQYDSEGVNRLEMKL